MSAYEKKAKKVLLAHLLAARLQAYNSPGDILAFLHGQINEIDQPRRANDIITVAEMVLRNLRRSTRERTRSWTRESHLVNLSTHPLDFIGILARKGYLC